VAWAGDLEATARHTCTPRPHSASVQEPHRGRPPPLLLAWLPISRQASCTAWQPGRALPPAFRMLFWRWKQEGGHGNSRRWRQLRKEQSGKDRRLARATGRCLLFRFLAAPRRCAGRLHLPLTTRATLAPSPHGAAWLSRRRGNAPATTRRLSHSCRRRMQAGILRDAAPGFRSLRCSKRRDGLSLRSAVFWACGDRLPARDFHSMGRALSRALAFSPCLPYAISISPLALPSSASYLAAIFLQTAGGMLSLAVALPCRRGRQANARHA